MRTRPFRPALLALALSLVIGTYAEPAPGEDKPTPTSRRRNSSSD